MLLNKLGDPIWVPPSNAKMRVCFHLSGSISLASLQLDGDTSASYSDNLEVSYLPLNAENPKIGFRGSLRSHAHNQESMPVLPTMSGSSAQLISVTVRWWALRIWSIEVLPTRKRFQIKLAFEVKFSQQTECELTVSRRTSTQYILSEMDGCSTEHLLHPMFPLEVGIGGLRMVPPSQ
jgi:hypothetical protein